MVYLHIMVRRICTALGTLVLSNVSAQNDTIFPNVSGRWDMTTTTWDWDGQDMNFQYFDHTLEYYAEVADTAFGLVWGAVFDYTDQVGWIAVEDRRVYYRATGDYYAGYGGYGDTTMRTLYDFELSVGDTAYFQNGEPELPAVVEDIDTTTVGGRPRQHFSLSNGDEWVAGVGSLEGLLRPFLYVFECGYSLDLFCGSYVDLGSMSYTTCLPDGIVEHLERPFELAPNPNNGQFFLLLAEPVGSYCVRDARGTLLVSGRVEGTSTVVNLANATAGLYILEVNGHRTKLIVE